jgi:hypothetical protein
VAAHSHATADLSPDHAAHRAVTSLTVEHFSLPHGRREERDLDRAGDRASEELAGRTVWCVSALPVGREAARALHDCLRRTGVEAVVVASMDVPATDELQRLAGRLEAMLDEAAGAEPRLGGAESELVEDGVRRADDALAAGVRADDVVVLHDALTAALARPVRERGAHAVWHVRTGRTRSGAAVIEARRFLARYTSPLQAYIASQGPAPGPGERLERIAALVPSTGLMAEKDVAHECGDLGWSAVLADVVHADRDETVGGTRHARPTVPVR